MRYKGINLGNVKTSNRSSILTLLNNQGAMSRKDIAEQVGLTAATVTLICNDLLTEGVICELGEAEEEKRAGRKKILVDINPDYKKVLCINLESNETHITVANIAGKVIGQVAIDTDLSVDPEVFLKAVADEGKKLLWENELPKEKILGVGVAIPGIVDRENGISVASRNLWDGEVRVAEILSRELDLNVILENNMTAFAESELLYGKGREEENLLLLKWGPGVGSAGIYQGVVFRAKSGYGVEIGHMTSNKNGKLCRCGNRGCLETFISTHAIIESVEKAFNPSTMPKLAAWLEEGNKLSYRNTSDWGVIQDEALQEILTETIDRLDLALRNVSAVANPTQVIVCGYLFDVPGFLERFKEMYKEYDVRAGEDYIVKSTLEDKLNYIVPLAIVTNELFF